MQQKSRKITLPQNAMQPRWNHAAVHLNMKVTTHTHTQLLLHRGEEYTAHENKLESLHLIKTIP